MSLGFSSIASHGSLALGHRAIAILTAASLVPVEPLRSAPLRSTGSSDDLKLSL